MSTVGIDHIAMPTANAERLIAFYKKLGFHINDEDEWRAGEANAFSIQVGSSKINVHPEGYTAALRVHNAGVEIIAGPGPRRGALRNRTAVSLYARDPDQNLLEWMIYE